jgi:hypothetical protein
VLSKTAKP